MVYSFYPPPPDAPPKPAYRLNLLDLPAPILYRIMAEHLGFADVYCLSLAHPFLAHVCGLLEHTRIVQSPSALRSLVNRLATSTVLQHRARAVRSLVLRWDGHRVRSSFPLQLPCPQPHRPRRLTSAGQRYSTDVASDFAALQGYEPAPPQDDRHDHDRPPIDHDILSLFLFHANLSSIVLDFHGALESFAEVALSRPCLLLPRCRGQSFGANLKRLTIGHGAGGQVTGFYQTPYLFLAISSLGQNLEELVIDGNNPTRPCATLLAHDPALNHRDFICPDCDSHRAAAARYPYMYRLRNLKIYNMHGLTDDILRWLAIGMASRAPMPPRGAAPPPPPPPAAGPLTLVLDDTPGFTTAGLIEVVKHLGDRLECLEINRPLFVGTASDSWECYLDDASRRSRRHRARSRHRLARAKCVTAAAAANVYCPTSMSLVAEQRAQLVDAARSFCPRLVHLRVLPEINKARRDSGFSASSSSGGGGGSLVSGSSTDIASLVLYE